MTQMLELSLRDSKEFVMKDLEEDVDDKYKQIKTFHISGNSKKENEMEFSPGMQSSRQYLVVAPSWSPPKMPLRSFYSLQFKNHFLIYNLIVFWLYQRMILFLTKHTLKYLGVKRHQALK